MPAKTPTRPHFWRITASYRRKEATGEETEVIPPFTMDFDAKVLHERKKYEAEDPQLVGEYIVVRKGAVGLLDSLLGRMRDSLKTAKRKK